MNSTLPISLAIVNARVWTGDVRRPWADAVAVRGDRIAAVGSSAAVRKLAAASARVIDAGGRLLVPGAQREAMSPGQLPDGAITRGGIADFTLIDDDGAPADPAAPAAARILLTVAAGQLVFDRSGSDR